MVKRYYQRWNSIRNVIEKRRADIEAAMVKYDPANLGVAVSIVIIRCVYLNYSTQIHHVYYEVIALLYLSVDTSSIQLYTLVYYSVIFLF